MRVAEVDVDVGGSRLSPWLHFGRVSAHQVFWRLARREGWTQARLGKVPGSRAGFWGMSPEAEAFLDECVTWRELGFNMASKRSDRYESLARWAQESLARHAHDRREHVYRIAKPGRGPQPGLERRPATAPRRGAHPTVRYMSLENTLRKLRAREYLRRWAT